MRGLNTDSRVTHTFTRGVISNRTGASSGW